MAKILLAEDDQSMCNFIEMALSKAGHSVTATQDGLEALSALDTRARRAVEALAAEYAVDAFARQTDLIYDASPKNIGSPDALRELGQTSVYLRGGELPWEHVTSVEPPARCRGQTPAG